MPALAHSLHFGLGAVLVVCGAACFVGAASEGLPCEDERECGVRLACIDGFCGGLGPSTSGVTPTTNPTEPTETSTTDDTSATTLAGPCDHVDEAERECDPDGNDRCTPDCRFAVCGDGYYNENHEVCDASSPEWRARHEREYCTPACQLAVFWDDAEDRDESAAKWVLDPESDGWRHRTGYWGSGPYQNTSVVFELRTISFDLPELPDGFRLELQIQHRYSFDTCPFPADSEPDGGVVRLFIGDEEQELVPIEGYPGVLDPASQCGAEPGNPLAELPAFVGQSPSDLHRFDLSQFAGQSDVQIAFVVGYDCGNCGTTSADAWHLDHVVVAAFPPS